MGLVWGGFRCGAGLASHDSKALVKKHWLGVLSVFLLSSFGVQSFPFNTFYPLSTGHLRFSIGSTKFTIGNGLIFRILMEH